MFTVWLDSQIRFFVDESKLCFRNVGPCRLAVRNAWYVQHPVINRKGTQKGLDDPSFEFPRTGTSDVLYGSEMYYMSMAFVVCVKI